MLSENIAREYVWSPLQTERLPVSVLDTVDKLQSICYTQVSMEREERFFEKIFQPSSIEKRGLWGLNSGYVRYY